MRGGHAAKKCGADEELERVLKRYGLGPKQIRQVEEALRSGHPEELPALLAGRGSAGPTRLSVSAPTGEQALRALRLLEPGGSYLVKERKPRLSFEMFFALVDAGHPGICISRIHPDQLRKMHPLSFTARWLSRDVATEDSISPTNPGVILSALYEFMQKNPKSVVLLEGLEYLVTNNSFAMVLKSTDALQEAVVLHKALLLLPVDPRAFDPKEMALLERNVRALSFPRRRRSAGAEGEWVSLVLKPLASGSAGFEDERE